MSQQNEFGDGLKLIKRAKEMSAADRFNEAVNLLHQVPINHVWLTQDLIFKSRMVQLDDEPKEDCLDEVKECLILANNQDPNSVEVLIEIGFFYSRKVNDCQSAIPFFNRAQDLIRDWTQELQEGLEECIE